MTLLSPRLDPRLCPPDLGQPRLAPRQFLGYRHPVGRLRLIRSINCIAGRRLQSSSLADVLRKNPLGIYVTAINWSKELGQ
jgi:hypothetical protein